MKAVFKILVIFPTLNKCGGIERIYLNYYKNMSKNFKVDFITHENDSKNYKKIIEEKGGKLYLMPKLGLKSMPKFLHQLKLFFENNHDYDIVHCNMPNASYFYFREAKKYNIKTRILHAHECQYADKRTHAFRNYFLINMGKKLATTNFACGKDAGEFLFKRNFTIINNAVNYDEFIFDQVLRKKVRSKYKLKESDYVLGNVGRCVPVKNQKFLIDIMAKSKFENLKLFIVGDGELEKDLKTRIKERNLTKKVFLVKSTDNINEYYCAFDMFVLPSIYEGLPLVGVEAQVMGLPCIFSKNVTKELEITNNVSFVELEEEAWIKEIDKFINLNLKRKKNKKLDLKFNILEQTKNLETNYIEAYKESNGD